MIRSGLVFISLAALAVTAGASPAIGGGLILVNGAPLPHAVSSLEATVEVAEYRDGNDPTLIKLVASSKRYSVCVLTPSPFPVFDAELPVADSPDRFVLTLEDGRELSACLVESLNTVERPGGRPRNSVPLHAYRYCLRCENVTVPAP